MIVVLCAFAGLRADTIYVGTLPTPAAKIVRFDSDQLIYEVNGQQRSKEYSKITRIDATGESPLDSAEQAFAAEKWDDAVDSYQKAIATASRQWIKDWSARRLLDAAQKSGRFDAAVSAYIVLLLKDPAVAAQHKPALPDSQSTFLNTAIDDVRNTLGDATLTPLQRKTLLSFQIELTHAKGDKAAEDAAYQQLAKSPGAVDSDPNVRRIAAQRSLDAAESALRAGRYAEVPQALGDDLSVYADAAQQADALFLLAQARDKSAGGEKTGLQDAALAYMRVVALAKDQPQHPHVVPSLMRTAEILSATGDAKSAKRLYQQIAAQYPDDPAAAPARQQAQSSTPTNANTP